MHTLGYFQMPFAALRQRVVQFEKAHFFSLSSTENFFLRLHRKQLNQYRKALIKRDRSESLIDNFQSPVRFLLPRTNERMNVHRASSTTVRAQSLLRSLQSKSRKMCEKQFFAFCFHNTSSGGKFFVMTARKYLRFEFDRLKFSTTQAPRENFHSRASCSGKKKRNEALPLT